MKKHLDFLTEEQAKDWTEVPGAILLSDWRPFSYMVILLDFENIIENNLIYSQCQFTITPEQYLLTEDKRISLKLIKLPKFNYNNLVKFVWNLKLGYEEITHQIGDKYLKQFNNIENLLDY